MYAFFFGENLHVCLHRSLIMTVDIDVGSPFARTTPQ
jgi:hypothetical protein